MADELIRTKAGRTFRLLRLARIGEYVNGKQIELSDQILFLGSHLQVTAHLYRRGRFVGNGWAIAIPKPVVNIANELALIRRVLEGRSIVEPRSRRSRYSQEEPVTLSEASRERMRRGLQIYEIAQAADYECYVGIEPHASGFAIYRIAVNQKINEE